MSNSFNFDYLNKKISTQYNDYKGIVAIDNHGDNRNFYLLLKDNGIDETKYLIYAITMCDSEPIGNRGLKLKFLLIERDKYGNTFDEIAKYQGKIELIEKYIQIPFSDIHKYIKRISIGMVSPISAEVNVNIE